MLHVGILLNSVAYRGIPAMRTGHESLANYEDAGQSNELVPCFLRLEDMDTASGLCRAYVNRGSGYYPELMPLPPVIHNRAIYLRGEGGRKIDKLIQNGTYVFNERSRFGKDEIHTILEEDPLLRPYLPQTLPGTLSSIRTLMARHGDIVIKPCSGSVGKGIMRLHEVRSDWLLECKNPASPARWTTLRLKDQELPLFVRRRLLYIPHIVQETIPLALYEERPFDVRVTVQRGYGGVWGVTGMFAKVAPPHTFLSNVAQGGTASPLPDILHNTFTHHTSARLILDLERLALQIAHRLAHELPGLGDIGLDLGITDQQDLYFIECNGRDQRYGFKQAGLGDIWKATYVQPMAYARWLLDNSPFADADRSLY